MYICKHIHTYIKSISDDLPHHIFLTAHFPRGLKCIYYPHNIQILFNIYVSNLYCYKYLILISQCLYDKGNVLRLMNILYENLLPSGAEVFSQEQSL